MISFREPSTGRALYTTGAQSLGHALEGFASLEGIPLRALAVDDYLVTEGEHEGDEFVAIFDRDTGDVLAIIYED